jgi:septal ring factor EnvC (AmiA/AmiB activator)
MARGVRFIGFGLLSLLLAASIFISGCTRYANEEQLTALDETQSAAVSAEDQLAGKKAEKAALEAKLAEKQAELKQVQAEKEKVTAKLQ